MSGHTDWQWKLREAVETIKARYDQIGRKTGAPFLAIVYPPEAEAPRRAAIVRHLGSLHQCDSRVLAFNINAISDSRPEPKPSKPVKHVRVADVVKAVRIENEAQWAGILNKLDQTVRKELSSGNDVELG